MKRFFVLIVTCSFICSGAVGKEKLPDLLDRLNTSQRLEEKLEIYWEIFLETLSDDPNLYYDLMVKFNDLAINHGSSEDKAKSFWAKAWLSQRLGNLDSAFENYLKSNYWYKQAGLVEFTGDGLKNIGNILKEVNEFGIAYQYYFSALDIYEDLKINPKIINTYRSISTGKLKEKNYADALKYANKALAKAINTHDDKYINIILNLVGMIYYYKKDYTTARNNYFNSIKNIDHLKNKTQILGMAYNNIGETFREQGNYEKAYEYFKQSLSKKLALNNPPLVATTLLNIGKLHLIEGKTDSAIVFLEKALTNLDPGIINENLQEVSSTLIKAYERKSNPGEKDYKRLLELNRGYISRIHHSNRQSYQKLLSLLSANDEVASQAQYHRQKAKSLRSRSIWIITLSLLAILGLLVLLYYREKRFKNFIKQMWQDIKDI
ncbi:tetratricopeptide repeat protein [Fulvivirgaceae bacterium BMA12]|uniref:Tetratricopeptide repeat protein n=1 Tax=Agaribacillus aureus TaxID=3051825 RepID=A0ABT8LFJ6_9BACT|nr:tetratricopeptide repeat protein [Fulvivirgaceae bacterium BMA12]